MWPFKLLENPAYGWLFGLNLFVCTRRIDNAFAQVPIVTSFTFVNGHLPSYSSGTTLSNAALESNIPAPPLGNGNFVCHSFSVQMNPKITGIL